MEVRVLSPTHKPLRAYVRKLAPGGSRYGSDSPHTGNPFSMGMPGDGEYVVDIGSGAGHDAVIAARAVGPSGHVVGVEMTEAMLERARHGAAELGLTNLEFRSGYTESLPFPDGWADLVISNGVINLSPEKSVAFTDIYRVLRPGGRIQIGDIIVSKPIPEGAKRNVDLWTNLIAGALLDAELAAAVEAAGFERFEITWVGDVFDGASRPSKDVTAFGTMGVNYRAVKSDK